MSERMPDHLTLKGLTTDELISEMGVAASALDSPAMGGGYCRRPDLPDVPLRR